MLTEFVLRRKIHRLSSTCRDLRPFVISQLIPGQNRPILRYGHLRSSDHSNTSSALSADNLSNFRPSGTGTTQNTTKNSSPIDLSDDNINGGERNSLYALIKSKCSQCLQVDVNLPFETEVI